MKTKGRRAARLPFRLQSRWATLQERWVMVLVEPVALPVPSRRPGTYFEVASVPVLSRRPGTHFEVASVPVHFRQPLQAGWTRR